MLSTILLQSDFSGLLHRNTTKIIRFVVLGLCSSNCRPTYGR